MASCFDGHRRQKTASELWQQFSEMSIDETLNMAKSNSKISALPPNEPLPTGSKKTKEIPSNVSVKNDDIINEDDFMEFLKGCETSCEPIAYKEPPKDLLRALKNHCREESIIDATWTLSIKVSNKIAVLGKGITKKKKQEIESKLQSKFPTYQFELTNLKPTSSDLSCIVKKKNYDQVGSNWECGPEAICGIILRGIQPHKDNEECLFAVTSAHLLLDDKVMRKFYGEPQKIQTRLKHCRENVQRQIDKYAYVALTQTTPMYHVHMCNPPLLVYSMMRHIRDALPHDYMMDMVLMPVEAGDAEIIRNLVNEDPILNSISSIGQLSPRMINRMVNYRVHAAGRRAETHRAGTITRMARDVEEQEDVMPEDAIPLTGACIPFVLDDRSAFLTFSLHFYIYSNNLFLLWVDDAAIASI